ncbi:protein Smg [bacterium MnTg03]|jgi:Smg protein|nr:protein Smg [bacterium MnTg03]
MKEGVIDVLMYIFSSYADQENNLPEDRDGIDADLRAAGFDSLEIAKAFEWLDGLALDEDIPVINQSSQTTRVFSPQETQRLADNAQGFLLFLEQSGVLTPTLRELVINRVMALDSVSEVDLEELKWVVMMVLFNSTEEHDENTLMHFEDIVFADQPAIFH